MPSQLLDKPEAKNGLCGGMVKDMKADQTAVKVFVIVARSFVHLTSPFTVDSIGHHTLVLNRGLNSEPTMPTAESPSVLRQPSASSGIREPTQREGKNVEAAARRVITKSEY